MDTLNETWAVLQPRELFYAPFDGMYDEIAIQLETTRKSPTHENLCAANALLTDFVETLGNNGLKYVDLAKQAKNVYNQYMPRGGTKTNKKNAVNVIVFHGGAIGETGSLVNSSNLKVILVAKEQKIPSDIKKINEMKVGNQTYNVYDSNSLEGAKIDKTNLEVYQVKPDGTTTSMGNVDEAIRSMSSDDSHAQLINKINRLVGVPVSIENASSNRNDNGNSLQPSVPSETSITSPSAAPGTGTVPDEPDATTSVVPAVPVTTSGTDPAVPNTTTGADPAVPVTTSGTDPVVPGATTGADPIVPVTTSGTDPAVPDTATGAVPIVPVTTSGTDPVVPGTTTGADPAVPVTTSGTDPADPGTTTGATMGGGASHPKSIPQLRNHIQSLLARVNNVSPRVAMQLNLNLNEVDRRYKKSTNKRNFKKVYQQISQNLEETIDRYGL